MTGRWWASALICGLLLAEVPALAHHSLAAEYNFDKPVRLKGVVTECDWVNPHSVIHVDVIDKNGKTTKWLFQTTLGSVRRQKVFVANKLVGETITIDGFAAQNGKPQAFIQTLTFPDGRKVTLWFGDPNG
jgi:hypothetical protein